jgi:hypothetical protein
LRTPSVLVTAGAFAPGTLGKVKKANYGLRESLLCWQLPCGNFIATDDSSVYAASQADTTSLRALLRLAAHVKWCIAGLDVCTAFLKAEMFPGVITPPPCFGSKVCSGDENEPGPDFAPGGGKSQECFIIMWFGVPGLWKTARQSIAEDTEADDPKANGRAERVVGLLKQRGRALPAYAGGETQHEQKEATSIPADRAVAPLVIAGAFLQRLWQKLRSNVGAAQRCARRQLAEETPALTKPLFASHSLSEE